MENIDELYEANKGAMDGMVIFGKIVKDELELKAFLKYGAKMLKPNAPSILYLRESPYFNGHLEYFEQTTFHYAMSYRSDADIYFPYGMVLSKENVLPMMNGWKSYNGKNLTYNAKLYQRHKVNMFK